MAEDKDNTHLFYKCIYVRNVLKVICELFKMQGPNIENTKDFIAWWNMKKVNYRNIRGLFHWAICCDKNKWIFREVRCYPIGTGTIILHQSDRLGTVPKPLGDLSRRMRPVEIIYNSIFFDGASQQHRCGCGAWLMLTSNCHYKIYWFRGIGTNMRAEILALRGLLWFASQLCIEDFRVFGDSKVLVDYLNRGN